MAVRGTRGPKSSSEPIPVESETSFNRTGITFIRPGLGQFGEALIGQPISILECLLKNGDTIRHISHREASFGGQFAVHAIAKKSCTG